MRTLQNAITPIRGGLIGALLAFGLVLSGCDNSSPTQVEGNTEKESVESFLTSSAPADKPGATELPGTQESERIPNEYIVVLDESEMESKSAAAVHTVAQSLLGKSGS